MPGDVSGFSSWRVHRSMQTKTCPSQAQVGPQCYEICSAYKQVQSN
ncbi:MAG: hypothetical protein OJF60_001975 [Burkholderiaceae bacterium]|nr:MAG: hypothetical protein OJF60_001975 [Burkholderiaceae bacterium]